MYMAMKKYTQAYRWYRKQSDFTQKYRVADQY